MHKFARQLLTEWRKLALPLENETCIVAVSGGADSVSLLIALHELKDAKKIKLNFIAAHFNHGLRGAESDEDARFVENLTKNLEIEFFGGIPNPEFQIQSRQDNLEQAARNARYEFLLSAAERFNAFGVLTAHTLNDQAETFLLNLIRGSGRLGLGAMNTIRKLNKNSEILLVRPLLTWAKRSETKAFARERKIDFRSDRMNDDEKFSRVRIRKTLLPLLAEFNPKIIETLAQTAGILQEEVARQTSENGPQTDSLILKDLKELSKPALYRILRHWLEINRGSLRRVELKHIEAIERLIFSRKSGRMVELPGRAIIIKKAGKLFFEETKVEKSPSRN